jgi:hypothetical protein
MPILRLTVVTLVPTGYLGDTPTFHVDGFTGR